MFFWKYHVFVINIRISSIKETAKNIKLDGQIRPIYWDHWDDDSQKFDVKEKADLIERHSKGEKINIIAKSIGTLVASLIIEKIPNQINKVVFCGIPVNDLKTEEIETIKRSISSLGDKALIIQNDKDPHGIFDQVKSFGKVISKPADNHDYPYYEEFQNFFSKF